MSPAAKRKTPLRRGPGRALLRWHRRIGVALSAIFIAICVTGILLNHTVDLDLDNKRVEADWIYKWYGIEPEGELVHYKVDEDSISHFSGNLYFNTDLIAPSGVLKGVASLAPFHLALTGSSLAMISREGELIESLSGSSLPAGTAISIHSSETGRAILETSEGFFRADADLLSWEKLETPLAPSFINASEAAPDLEAALVASFRGEGISWNRVILDIHSGNFFGPIGKWIVDFSALCLIFLTLTGVWYTTKYLKKARERALSK
ncbi:PepSY-associated TM helix domain-containing protein [Pelagicoccus mobilis]|uniref:PepSY domain-containing protein n=1 Tax=Pelagicoccus mobilis TaxID=415221 RepID=A0A934RXQ3_9BACT|nr:PepSY-associated TM helix domain-containing protein [Pelagicoccus mobilis]MBK1876282.1 PepSY domain-containing protein [Pelagicoccus mobilis]